MAPQPMMQTRKIASSSWLLAGAATSAALRRHRARLYSRRLPGLARLLQQLENTVAVVERIVNDDALVKQRILQRGGKRMYRRRPAFSHAFGAVEAVRRGRLDIAKLHVGHVHRGDWRVIAEGRSQHVAHFVVEAALHQRRADAVPWLHKLALPRWAD